MFWIDSVYFWYVFIPTMLISLGVQFFLNNTFRQWSRVPDGSLTGPQTVQQRFGQPSLTAIPVARIKGSLTDHFDPSANFVRLSDPVATQPTVASKAVTAHELGPVQQYQTGSGLIKLRSARMPAFQFSPTLSSMRLTGLSFEMTNLFWLRVFFLALLVIFSLLTRPVESNASRRALKLLEEAGLMNTNGDRNGLRAVLNAAALTYLAAAITSVLQLRYYICIAQPAS